MLQYKCFVLEDIMQHGMYMAPTEFGVDDGYLTFRDPKDAEEYLWSRDCLIAMGYRVMEVAF